MARPTKYTKELDDIICTRLADGESLRSICNDDGIPHKATVLRWVFQDNEETIKFRDHYKKARDMQAESFADELNDIADDGTNDWMERNDPDNPGYAQNGEALQRSRLRVDTRKWVASRILPKYSEKKETTLTLNAAGDFLEAIKPTTGLPKDRE